jgi:hypothetical protein
VYRNATDFCILILYPAVLLNVFMKSMSFLVEFFRSFRYRIVSASNRDNFLFPIGTLFISFSCLTAMAKNFSAILSKSDQGTPLSLS